MKIISTRAIKSGPRDAGTRVTIDLLPGEEIKVFRADDHYKLGEPHDDVIQGHVLLAATPTYWDSLSQKWIE